MTVRKEKQEELQRKMASLGIREEDLMEKFILGSGKGGQKINKTASCVYLKHLPTGIEIKCQESRSREENRFFARRMLVEKMDEIIHKSKSKKQMEIDKVRKQKKRRVRRSRENIAEKFII